MPYKKIQIEKDDVIRNKFHKGYERKNSLGIKIPVTTFVVHGTQGGGTLNWWRNADGTKREDRDRVDKYIRGVGLTQYFIDTKGVITEITDPDYWYYHSSCRNKDARTIGVELENKTKDNSGVYNAKQYEAVLDLYCYLRWGRDFNKMVDIKGHDRIKMDLGQKPKKCPGTGFKWNVLENMLTDQGYLFYTKDKSEYAIYDIKDPLVVG